MECVEAALKTSIRKEMSLKATSSPQLHFDDFLSTNLPNSAPSCDDFFVDDLLDFSNEDIFVEESAETSLEDNKTKENNTLHNNNNDKYNVVEECNKTDDQFGSLLPAEDLESLEWLSHFFEDSFTSFPKTGISPVKTELRREEVAPPPFKTPVPGKARSKRSRTGGRVWSLGSPTFTESSSSSSSSSPTSPLIIVSTGISPGIEAVEKSGGKKQRRKFPVQLNPVQPRGCSHCGVQKTPQWRAGPLGAKTLCNACGVRYKSGRLLPEYRPACSPTFSSELHSNHHRKIIEMRKKKEAEGAAAVTPAVPSFEN